MPRREGGQEITGMIHFQPGPGTCALRVRLLRATNFSRVGPFGAVALLLGPSIHVGSAPGSDGADGVGHHLRHAVRPRCYRDDIRPTIELLEGWVTYDPGRRECAGSSLVDK